MSSPTAAASGLFRCCWIAVLLLLGLLQAGCAADGTLTLEAVNGYANLEISYPTRVVLASDSATADFYLTDLPPELWRPGADLSGVSGTLVHLHLFLPPAAGRAPMGENASNLSIRYVVIAGGEIGTYAGGGFFYVDGKLDGRRAGGNFSGASMRLVRASPNFRDILGASRLGGSFSARKDPENAEILRTRLSQLLDLGRKIQ